METIDTKLVNFFNSYLFGNVWNEPSKEYRRNIRPLLLSKPVANTSIKLDYKRYDLPTAEKYQVYYIPESTMRGITFRSFPDWTTSVEFLNSSSVELRFHNDDGIMLPREKVFVANHPESPGVLIAIKRDVFRSIFGIGADVNDLFVAFYYDSDVPNPVTISTYTLDGGTNVNAVYAETLTATAVYVNGIATEVNDISDISFANAIVEIVKDENVTGTFKIDLTVADEKRNFISDIDNGSKTIVHIPKALNPTNQIISHNTCDLWIYPRNGSTANRNGRFLHRAIEDYTFSQITHNDFAIPDVILNTYSDTLNTDEFKLVIQIKPHSKDNVLITEKNFIELLYTHDDATILDFMEGVGPEDFDFWKANTLEASEYATMIVDTPDFVDISSIPKYIAALGYYNSIALISNRVKTMTLQEYGGEISYRFIVPIPVVFETINIDPSMFVNGIKLDNNLVTVNKIQSGSVVIDVDESVPLVDGDIVKVELFENLPLNLVEVRPTASYNHINVVNDNFVLYEVVDTAGAVDGINGVTYDKVHIRIDDISTVGAYVDSVIGRYIAFNAGSYGRRFIVSNNLGFDHRSYELDTLLENNEPLVFDLTTRIKSIDFDPPYEWEDHTSKISASGEVYDPDDVDVEDPYPAWNLMDGDETWALESRWVKTLRPEGNVVNFDLDAAHQNSYWLIGYRIGALPVANDALRASQLPINWQVRVDGNLVDSVTGEWWYLNPEPVHTHMLSTPVSVNSQVSLSIPPIQTDGVFQIQTDMFEPIFSDAAEITDVPLLGDVTCIPYLNGRELVKDIDYHLADIQSDSHSGVPHICGRQLIIHNIPYLEESGNRLEVLITNNDVDGQLIGYVEQDVLGDPGGNPRWFDELSILSANGKVEENESNNFGSIKITADNTTGVRYGAPYGSRTLIPEKSKYFVNRYYPYSDSATLDALTTYFRELTPEEEIVVMPNHSHRIISIRLFMIVRDMINGSLVVPYDPSDSVILSYLTDYDYLKQYDIVYDAPSNVDLEYVDIQAMYTDQEISNGDLLLQINRVIQVLVDGDTITYLRPDHEA